MTSYFPLELDTRAPQGTLQLIAAVAGQACRVRYELDENEAVSGVCVLEDGRHITMLVPGGTSDEASCDLPPDAPSSASVQVTVRDDVGNEAILALTVAIEGSAPVAAPAPESMPAARPGRIPRRLVRTRARAGSSSATRVLAQVHDGARVQVQSGDRIRRRFAPIIEPEVPVGRALIDQGRAGVRVADVLAVGVADAGSAGLAVAGDSMRVRRESPAVLMLLDVL